MQCVLDAGKRPCFWSLYGFGAEVSWASTTFFFQQQSSPLYSSCHLTPCAPPDTHTHNCTRVDMSVRSVPQHLPSKNSEWHAMCCRQKTSVLHLFWYEFFPLIRFSEIITTKKWKLSKLLKSRSRTAQSQRNQIYRRTFLLPRDKQVMIDHSEQKHIPNKRRNAIQCAKIGEPRVIQGLVFAGIERTIVFRFQFEGQDHQLHEIDIRKVRAS